MDGGNKISVDIYHPLLYNYCIQTQERNKMATNKDIAAEIYTKHLALASTDGRMFRKTVMDEIMDVCGCSLAASATFYNNCKKGATPIEGLGRPPVPKGLRRPNSKGKEQDILQDDNDCFSVIEIEHGNVARMQSFLMQGDASEEFDSRIVLWPNSTWVLIQGLGPNFGDTFKLEIGEKEIKRYPQAKDVVAV